LVATWQPSLATVGSVAPLETSGALASCRGNCPWLASPSDTSETDGGFEELLGHGGLVRVTDLALEGGRKGVGIVLWANKAGFFNKLDVSPRRVLLNVNEGAFIGERRAVREDGGHCVELEDRMRVAFQLMNVNGMGLEIRENGVENRRFELGINGLVENQSDMAAEACVDLLDTNVDVLLAEVVVNVSNDGGDITRRFDAFREAHSQRIAAYAFDKACGSLPGCRGRGKWGRGGFEVGVSDSFEQDVLRGPGELLGYPLIASNRVLNNSGGGCGSCLFWASGLGC
jgi:hypothetical protein